ncbi:toll/interleukin-1 receptor domain-containing protein [bacterium]|nr:MAG: toll/interleukin-1 receptor domain-containing protein [bacterium]
MSAFVPQADLHGYTAHAMETNMKDIFVSHAHKDKHLIEPLLSALERNGITYWYDNLELVPGDSFSTKINYGLKSCKIILLCLSENFVNGNFAQNELNAAFALAKLQNNSSLLVPLIIGDYSKVLLEYPVQLANILYLSYDSGFDSIVRELKKVLSSVSDVSKEYWFDEGRKAFEMHHYDKATIYFAKSIDIEPMFLPALVCYVKLLLIGNEYDVIRQMFEERDDKWDAINDVGVDIKILDCVQDSLSMHVDKYNELSYKFKNSLLDFMFIERNRENSWKYLLRFFGNSEFSVFSESIIGAVVSIGKEKATEPLIEMANKPLESQCKKLLATAYFILASKLPMQKRKILRSVNILMKDEDEAVRIAAMTPYYYFADDGNMTIFKCLNSKMPEIRYTAFVLLLNKYRQKVGDNWLPGEKIDGEPDSKLTTDVIAHLYADPSEAIRQEVRQSIKKGWLPKQFLKLQMASEEELETEEEDRIDELFEDLTLENVEILKIIAKNSVFTSSRQKAVEGLVKFEGSLDDEWLISLLEEEEALQVRNEIKTLLITKLSNDRCDYIALLLEKEIINNNIKKEEDIIATAFERIAISNSK